MAYRDNLDKKFFLYYFYTRNKISEHCLITLAVAQGSAGENPASGE